MLPDLDDGSPSTVGVPGRYTGGICGSTEFPTPEGTGSMIWENGVTYDGEWKAGRYDGQGSKL